MQVDTTAVVTKGHAYSS